MFDVIRLTPGHLHQMALEPMNSFVQKWPKDIVDSWVDCGRSYSGFVGGELMVCVGIAEYWEGRAHIWALFSERARGRFVTVFRGMQRFLDGQPYRRLEMDIPLCKPYTDLALRRACLLGFEKECIAKKYLPSGQDAIILSRLRGA